MKFKFIAPTLLMAFSLFQGALADEAIRFIPETYPIGYVGQGDVKHFVLKGANVTDKEIVLENVFGQGVGMSNFKYPKKIPAKGTISIEFDFDFSNMDGPIAPVVVLVDTTGKPYTATMDGIVKAPFFFSEQMFDAGYYAKGEKREWTFYVWETDKKGRPDINIDAESAKQFGIKTKPVMLNVDKLDQIKEGGKVPGLKVTLYTKTLSREGWELKQQSIRKIIAFKSKKYPKATPEVLVIGYWK